MITVKQLRWPGARRWFWFGGKLLLLFACMFGALATVWLTDLSILPIRLNLFLALFTDLDFWRYGLDLPLQLFNWSWYGILLIGLLSTSLFLFVTLTVKAVKNGQIHWFVLAVCLTLLLTLGVNNLETFYGNSLLFTPPHLFSFPAFFWDAAPFLGLSALLLAVITGETNPLLSRRSWWVGVGMALLLCLELSAIIREIVSLLHSPGNPGAAVGASMHFWPLTPLLTMALLGIATSLILVALARGRRVMKGLTKR